MKLFDLFNKNLNEHIDEWLNTAPGHADQTELTPVDEMTPNQLQNKAMAAVVRKARHLNRYGEPIYEEDDLADNLYHELENSYPGLVRDYGHEVVGDAILAVVRQGKGSNLKALAQDVVRIIKNRVVETTIAEGLSKYNLNLAAIEQHIGEICIDGGISAKNQHIYKWLAEQYPNKNMWPLFDAIICEKLEHVYGNKTLTEDANKDKNLVHIFNQFNSCATGNKVKPGDSISVIELSAYINSKTIYVESWLTPHKVVQVDAQFLYLDNKEIFPNINVIQQNMQVWKQIIFFRDSSKAENCLTMLSLFGDQYGDWKIEFDNHDAVSEDDSDVISHMSRDLMNPDAGKMAKLRHRRDQEREDEYRNAQYKHDEVEDEVDEGLGDDFAQFLKDKNTKHRIQGTADQERQRTADMIAAREKARSNAPTPPNPDVDRIPELEAKLKSLMAEFDPNYQYSDDHGFWSKQNQLHSMITALKRRIADAKKSASISEDQFVNEISYSSGLGDLAMSSKELISQSSIDGTIGSKKVFLFASVPNKIYFFSDGSNIEALIYLVNDRLMAMKNFSGNKGLIYNLFQYIVNIKQEKITLSAKDKLTSEGIDWIIGQIKRPEGFKISSQDGNPIDAGSLYDEWERSRVTGTARPTDIVISESKNAFQIQENEKRLIPMDIFGVTSKQIHETTIKRLYVPDLFESYNSQFKSKEAAIAYAKERIKTFRDPDDGIEIYAMPDGGCDVVHTMNSNGRNHVIQNGGKKLGTVGPRYRGVAEKQVRSTDLDEEQLNEFNDTVFVVSYIDNDTGEENTIKIGATTPESAKQKALEKLKNKNLDISITNVEQHGVVPGSSKADEARKWKQSMLQKFAHDQLKTEYQWAADHDVFMNKEQILAYIDAWTTDDKLTPLEFMHNNGFDQENLFKGFLSRLIKAGFSKKMLMAMWHSFRKTGSAGNVGPGMSSLMAKELLKNKLSNQGVTEGNEHEQYRVEMIDRDGNIAGIYHKDNTHYNLENMLSDIRGYQRNNPRHTFKLYINDKPVDWRELASTQGVTEDLEDYEGLKIKLSQDDDGVAVRALSSNGAKELGMAELFYDEQGRLDPQTLWVDERYYGQGIAKAMYDYLKNKGFTVIRSWDQTPSGKGFWDKHRGPEVTVWEGSVAESDPSGLWAASQVEQYVACMVDFNRSGQAIVRRSKPTSKAKAHEIIKNALAKNTFVHPPFMTVYPASAGRPTGEEIMKQFPNMSKQGVAEGFSVRSDHTWRSKILEMTDNVYHKDFATWLSQYETQVPEKNSKCILALIIHTGSISVDAGKPILCFYGIGTYLGEDENHYIITNKNNIPCRYNKKDQKVFKSPQDFEKFKLTLSLKFGDADYQEQDLQEDKINELSSDTLSSYKEKAKKSADELTAAGKHKQSTNRWGNVMKATGKQIDKTSANIQKALKRTNEDELSEASLNSTLRKHGEQILSTMDAERRLSAGERIFAYHELDELPTEITSIDELENWAPDQLLALPAGLGEGWKSNLAGLALAAGAGAGAVGYHDATKDVEYKGYQFQHAPVNVPVPGIARLIKVDGRPLLMWKDPNPDAEGKPVFLYKNKAEADAADVLESVGKPRSPGVASSAIPKPRNFVAKNVKVAGKAGAHKDKKLAQKQGDVKHKRDLTPVSENFVSWAMRQEEYKDFAKNPEIYESARQAYKKLL